MIFKVPTYFSKIRFATTIIWVDNKYNIYVSTRTIRWNCLWCYIQDNWNELKILNKFVIVIIHWGINHLCNYDVEFREI